MKILQGTFIKNVAALMAGTTFAQAMGIVVAPY
jgi:hypothetical protein